MILPALLHALPDLHGAKAMNDVAEPARPRPNPALPITVNALLVHCPRLGWTGIRS